MYLISLAWEPMQYNFSKGTKNFLAPPKTKTYKY